MLRIFISFIFVLPYLVSGQGEKILSRHLEKYGQSTWSQIQTLKILGKHVSEDYSAYPLTIINKENRQIFVEAQDRGQNDIIALDHQVFWTSGSDRPFQALEKLILQYAITIGSPLSMFSEESIYSGLDVIDGATFHTFKMKREGHTVRYFIEKESFELRYILLLIEGKEPMSAKLTFDKYKSHHGLLMPTAMTISIEGEFKEWVFDEILLGIAIDEKIFIKPNSQ